MNKLSLFLHLPVLLLTQFRAFLKNLYHFSVFHKTKSIVRKKHNLPNGFPTLDFNTIMPDFREEVINYTYLDGTSRLIDLAVLRAICRKYENCEYMEIGSWRGESLSNVAQVASKVVSISLSAEDMVSRGWKSEAKFQRLFSKGLTNVEHIEHDSITFDYDNWGRTFDVIFVDGDHSYDAVKSDTHNVFKLLKDEKSIIMWHDTTTGYEKPRWEVVAGILDGAPAEARSKIYHISNCLISIYIPWEIETSFPPSPQVPNKTFTAVIESIPFSADQ